jgi:hypothetical protein
LGFNFLKNSLGGFGFPDEYLRSALAGTISPVFTSGNQQVAQIAVNTVAFTISRVFGTVIAAGALLLVSSILMKREKLTLNVVAGG